MGYRDASSQSEVEQIDDRAKLIIYDRFIYLAFALPLGRPLLFEALEGLGALPASNSLSAAAFWDSELSDASPSPGMQP